MLDGVSALNAMEHERWADLETRVRIEQYEMAFRMQASVPELTALDKEPESTYALYGEDARKSGTFAYSALMARRLVERGVRFVDLSQGVDVQGICRRCCRRSARTWIRRRGRWCRTEAGGRWRTHW